MKRLFHIILLCFVVKGTIAQTEFQVNKLAAFCKVWGFLKYYHPKITEQNIDWDSVLISGYPKVKNAISKDVFNDYVLSVLDRLGELAISKHPFKPVDSISINADFKWIGDTTILSGKVSGYLQAIKKNHEPFFNRYVKPGLYGNPLVQDSGYYSNIEVPEEYRFLALSRYWNIIEYYYPYKYLMDTNWNEILKEAIPEFISASRSQDYYCAMRWLNAKLNDSHAGFVTSKFYQPYKSWNIPFSLYYNNDTLIIADILNDSLCRKQDIRYGDIISKIDGVGVSKLWESTYRHLSSSNEAGAKFEAIDEVLFTKGDSITFEIKRNNEVLKRVIGKEFNPKFHYKKDYSAIIRYDSSFSVHMENKVGKKFGYINMHKLQKEDIPNVAKKIEGLEYLIIDLRCYPNNTDRDLASILFDEPKSCAMPFIPNYDYPGYIKYSGPLMISPAGNTYYKGKVIILVDHSTMSQAEYSAMILRKAPGAIVIGSQTGGADGNLSFAYLPGGYIMDFSGSGIRYPDGRETQRIGIIPDIKVDYTARSILQNLDPIMERALEFIRTDR